MIHEPQWAGIIQNGKYIADYISIRWIFDNIATTFLSTPIQKTCALESFLDTPTDYSNFRENWVRDPTTPLIFCSANHLPSWYAHPEKNRRSMGWIEKFHLEMDDGLAEWYFQVQRGIYMLPFIFPEIELVSNEFISNLHLSLYYIFQIWGNLWNSGLGFSFELENF